MLESVNTCASFISRFVPWCTTNEDNITLIKYQMNRPGACATLESWYSFRISSRRRYTSSFIPAESIPGTTTIDVFGEDLVSHNLYEVSLIYAVFSFSGETLGYPEIR